MTFITMEHSLITYISEQKCIHEERKEIGLPECPLMSLDLSYLMFKFFLCLLTSTLVRVCKGRNFSLGSSEKGEGQGDCQVLWCKTRRRKGLNLYGIHGG